MSFERTAYLANALAHPDLYRAMFDAGFDLEDPRAAADSFAVLVLVCDRADQQESVRFANRTDPEASRRRSRYWVFGEPSARATRSGMASMPDGNEAEVGDRYRRTECQDQ